MSEHELTERARLILDAIISDYMETGAPIGSRTIVRKYGMDLSPATVRNEMSDLTDLGFLRQTHVSSGRAPTDKGIRYYLDNIVKVQELAPEKQEFVRSMFPSDAEDSREIVKASSAVLASLTRYAGVAWSPGIEALPLRRIEFLWLADRRIMAIIVSPGGWFQTSVFEWEEAITVKELNYAAGYLNERFQGKTLQEMREEIIAEMRAEKAEYDRLLKRAYKLLDSALRPASEEVYIEGKTNLVENPEFADVGKMKAIFKTFEEKGLIVKILNKAIEGNEVRVVLSSEESAPNLPGLALIVAGYGAERDVHGSLGVIGPMRMDYRMVIPLVRYIARYVSSRLGS